MNKRQRKKAKRKEMLKRITIIDSQLPIIPGVRTRRRIRQRELIRLLENFHRMMNYGKLWNIARENVNIVYQYQLNPIAKTSHDGEPALECFESWKFKPYDPQEQS